MDIHEKKWLEGKISRIETQVDYLSNRIQDDSKYLRPDPDTVKDLCLERLSEIWGQLQELRHDMTVTYRDEMTGQVLQGFAACALREWESMTAGWGLHRCQRTGWKTMDRCECHWPDGTPLIHEPLSATGGKVLNRPRRPVAGVPDLA